MKRLTLRWRGTRDKIDAHLSPQPLGGLTAVYNRNMKGMIPPISIFAGTFFIGVNTWSAFEVLVRGQYEGEFGGPLSNLVFGAVFSVGLVTVVTAGYFDIMVVAWSFFRCELSRSGSIIAAVVAILLTLSATIGRFLDTLPLGNWVS